MTLAQRQRAALCDNFERVGALAPTRCGDWLAQDLAAHLWIREHRLAALPGIGSARFAARTQQIQTEALHRFGFLGLVNRLRSVGPIMAPLDRLVNASEYLIHNFDLARANDLAVDLTRQDQAEVLRVVKLFARMTQRSFGNRLVVEPQGFVGFAIGQGDQPTHVAGAPSELLLWLSGRDWAQVEVIGEPSAVLELSDARRSL